MNTQPEEATGDHEHQNWRFLSKLRRTLLVSERSVRILSPIRALAAKAEEGRRAESPLLQLPSFHQRSQKETAKSLQTLWNFLHDTRKTCSYLPNGL